MERLSLTTSLESLTPTPTPFPIMVRNESLDYRSDQLSSILKQQNHAFLYGQPSTEISVESDETSERQKRMLVRKWKITRKSQFRRSLVKRGVST